MRTASLLILLVALFVAGGQAKAQIIYGNPSAVDGDTLDFGGGRVRLFGIDAPERNQTCQRASETWACGEDATILLGSLIERQKVTWEQRDTDRFGRPVAVCKASGTDLAEAMARTGFAVALEGFSADYAPFVEQARAARIGIWAGTFQEPAAFRASDPLSLAETAEHESSLAAARRQDMAPSRPTGSSYAGASFRNCHEARAAGAAPFRRGQPGYRIELDADGDGIACEPIRPR